MHRTRLDLNSLFLELQRSGFGYSKEIPKKKKNRANLQLYAYTDESGNTGENLFDEAQPVFWTGTLLSRKDMHIDGAPLVRDCQILLRVQELHGKELGFQGISKIASRLERLIETSDSHFLFTLHEKSHRAAIRLVEMLFDSDFNQAVSPSHDILFPFRKMLSLPVVTCLTRGDKKKFWDAYVKGNHELFCEVLDTLRFRIHENITDPRGRELLLDTIVWALKYPALVLRPKPAKGHDIYSLDSPNIAAFISLLDGLHDLMKPSGAKIVKFHHDVQSQFGNAIAETFKVLHRVTMPQNSLLVEKVKTFGCPIEFLPSQASIGVQLIDVCLWLMVKSFKGAVLPESYNLRSLLGCILGRGLIKENSLEQLKSDCEADNHRMMSMEISDKQLADGKQFTQQQEARRIRRMNSPPEA